MLQKSKKFVSGVFLAALALLLALAPVTAIKAADHGDAPATGSDLGADLNDGYLFLDPNDNTQAILIMTIHGFIVPGENGNFGIFDRAIRYRFEIENTGDARPDAFIDVTFNQRTSGAVGQTATVAFSGLANNLRFTAPATNSSPAAPVAPTQVITTNSGIRFFAGLTDDPFFFDIPAFGRFVGSVRAGAPNPSVFARGRDSFAGYNTMAIAFSIPVNQLRGAAGNEVGLSLATQRRNPEVYNGRTGGQIAGFGRWVNIDRTGVPAVNVALVPFNSKDPYNSASTMDDAAGRFAPGIVATLNFFGTPAANIGILASVAVTRGDILRLNTATANSGTGGGNNAGAGFPNGRRLVDDVIDTELQIIGNNPAFGDGVPANDLPFQNAFPFLAPSQQPRAPGTLDDNTRN